MILNESSPNTLYDEDNNEDVQSGYYHRLMVLALLINPDVVRAQNFNYRGCAWPIELSPEGSGNVQGPDGATRHWAMPFDTQYETMTIKGTYPNVRYFSFAAYETIGYDPLNNKNKGFHLAEHHLYDVQINLDPGSANPFVPAGGRNGNYTVTIGMGLRKQHMDGLCSRL